MKHAGDRGWELLREHRAADALDVFGETAQANPSSGGPKIGYALAAAELGRLDRGIWAMRRALRFDPDSLHYVTIDDGLRPMVERLTARYDEADQVEVKWADSHFMLAVLHYLLGNYDTAQDSIEQAMNAKDKSVSARNLLQLIKESA